MITGIGTDIIEVARVKNLLLKQGAREKVFTPAEIAYCEQDKTMQSYAARFAAKEAFLKALGTGWRGQIQLNEIEVVANELGKPFIHLKGATQQIFDEKGGGVIHVSLAHIQEHATAYVIIEQI